MTNLSDGDPARGRISRLTRATNSIKYRSRRTFIAAVRAAARLAGIDRRRHRSRTNRLLVIDDRVPHIHLGTGYPRSNFMLAALVELGYGVSFYPLLVASEDRAGAHADIPAEVEIIFDHGTKRLKSFLKQRGDEFDVILVSRPHNMATVGESLPALHASRIVYDAEAIFCMREIVRARLNGHAFAPAVEQKMIDEEIALAAGSDAVISVSEAEARRFADRGCARVYALSHALDVPPTPNPFEFRRDVLFVGPTPDPSTPNADSITWFVEEIFPRLRAELDAEVKFLIAGSSHPEIMRRLAGETVVFLGRVDDLTEHYNRARLFVAPTRFAAGVPLKIYEAAAHGLPVVATPLLASQLGWQTGTDLLTGETAAAFAAACARLYRDPERWQDIRSNALRRMQDECSPAAFTAQLKRIVEDVLD